MSESLKDFRALNRKLDTELSQTTDGLGTPIEKGIVLSVKGMIMQGFETMQSCEGHWESHGLPYPWISVGIPSIMQKYDLADKIAYETADNSGEEKDSDDYWGIIHEEFDKHFILTEEDQQNFEHELAFMNQLLLEYYTSLSRIPDYPLSIVTNAQNFRVQTCYAETLEKGMKNGVRSYPDGWSAEDFGRLQKDMQEFGKFLVRRKVEEISTSQGADININ